MRQQLLLLLLVGLATKPLSAQTLDGQTYVATIVTKTGYRSQGILYDVTAVALYCDPSTMYNPDANPGVIPLETIRKVIIRRTHKPRAIRAGAVVGGLLVGFLTLDGLKNNPTQSSVAYGLALLLGTGTGVAIGAGAGALVGGISHRVFRPGDRENSLEEFRRQLEPFSIRYQNNLFNRTNQ